MSTATWSVRLASAYGKDLTDLKKRHYKKNRRAAEELDEFLYQLMLALEVAPVVSHLDHPKTKLVTKDYPKGHAVEGAIFRTARFRMPGLSGAAAHGRVYFDVHREARIVRVLGVYTHAEHQPELGSRLLVNRLKQTPLF